MFLNWIKLEQKIKAQTILFSSVEKHQNVKIMCINELSVLPISKMHGFSVFCINYEIEGFASELKLNEYD